MDFFPQKHQWALPTSLNRLKPTHAATQVYDGEFLKGSSGVHKLARTQVLNLLKAKEGVEAIFNLRCVLNAEVLLWRQARAGKDPVVVTLNSSHYKYFEVTTRIEASHEDIPGETGYDVSTFGWNRFTSGRRGAKT